MKERVRAYVDHDEPSELEQLEMMNGLDRRLGLTLPRTKRTEIVRANQRCRGGTHPLDIQRAMVPGDLFRHMRRPNLIVIDHIAVTTGHCAETRIKMRGHLLGPGHADVGRKVHVRPHYPGVHAPFYRGVEMHHLAAGMHQRIGSAGATERNGMPAGDSGQGILQRLLNGRHTGALALEPAITGSFVLDTESYSGNADGSHFGCRFGYCLVHDQASLASISRASCCCTSLPSEITSSRISRAPSASPMSM